MRSFSLVVEPKSLRTSSGTATGIVWVSLDGQGFPANGWDDLVVILLGAFAYTTLRLIRRESNSEEVSFMEGPYHAELGMDEGQRMTIRLFADELPVGDLAFSPARSFVENMVSDAREVLELCRAQGWWSADAGILQERLSQLDVELADPTRWPFDPN